MSTDVEPKTADQNAQAAEDAQKLLAELKGESASAADANATEANGADANGTAEPVTESKETKETSETSKGANSERTREKGNTRGRGGARGRGGYRNHRNDRDNIKSDLTTLEVTDDPVAIRKQVEFYFSDSNLPMDKFLLSKVGGSTNNAVELQIIHSFKRMRRFQPFEALVKALKDSTFLELTDNDTAVKRKEPLPVELNDGPDPSAIKVFEDKAMPRSVYVKGFGEEIPSTQFDIEAFFLPYGPTNAIRLRRTDDKIFKRSVFVEFETEELARKFLELDPKPKFKGTDLLIMSKKEYCDKKVEDIKSGRIKAGRQRFDGRGGKDFKRKRDNEDDRDWRERRDEDRKSGHRNDRRRGSDRNARERGGRDQRSDRAPQTDENGIPIVKSSSKEDDRSGHETQKADALAQARAAVAKEEQKEAAADETIAKKRSRDADDTGDAERDAKKQDIKDTE